jgi:protein-S-isoprenylcysteine O-methyltransferase Ste14
MTKANLFILGQFALLGLLVALFGMVPFVVRVPLLVLGTLLALSGLAVVLLAVREHQQRNQVSPRVSPVPRSRVGLVETGLYAYVRHPIYSGVLLATAGIALAHGTAAALSVWLLLVGWFTLKSSYEEELLLAQFPTYAAYRQRTGRFIPLWRR